MDDQMKKSKGFGFVCFKTADEATRAVTEMMGAMLEGKPLCVPLAHRNEGSASCVTQTTFCSFAWSTDADGFPQALLPSTGSRLPFTLPALLCTVVPHKSTTRPRSFSRTLSVFAAVHPDARSLSVSLEHE